MNSKNLIHLLKQDGWYEVKVRGSHHYFKHPTKEGKVTVPHPKKDLPLGTVRAIKKSAGI